MVAAIKRRILLLLFLFVGIVGCVLATAWMLLAIVFYPSSQRAWHILIAFDQLGNATSGGSEDETISSRAGRKRKDGRKWACLLCRFLDWFDNNHCENSIGT